MGAVNNLVLLEKGLKATFNKAHKSNETDSIVQRIAMMTKSTSSKEGYAWLGQSPSMQKWIDERKSRGLRDFRYDVINDDYEATIEVPKNAWDDDELGNIPVRVRDLSAKAKKNPIKLILDLLKNGTVGLCYDGQAFFSAGHEEGKSGVQSNLKTYAVAGALPTVAEFKVAFISARAVMRAYLDDQGEPREEADQKFVVYVSPDLEGVADETFNALQIGNTTNTLKGKATVEVSARLSGNDFYLLNEEGELKPFINQEREAAKFEALTTGDQAFKKKIWEFGVSERRGVSYGLWHKALKMSEA